MLKLRPDFRVTDHYFYVPPVEHVLCGFLREKGTGGAYIWWYAFPLFDRNDFIHLGFGDRLHHPKDFMPTQPSVNADAAEFLRRIQPHEANTLAHRELTEFLKLAESRANRGNPRIDRVYGMTLIMRDRGLEAESVLKRVLAAPGVENYPGFREDVSEVLGALSRGVDRAKAVLLEWEEQMKDRFEIESAAS